MNEELVYPFERTLGIVTLVLGTIVWIALVVGTMGVALAVLFVLWLLYLFAHSALIAHIRGDGVELTEAQFPDLHAHFAACCEKLGLSPRPRAFVLNGNGVLNAFATKFLRTEFLVVLSSVVDAMDRHPDGIRFYVGHELGHLRRKHLRLQFLRWPVLWLPLLGAAYSRARESTCDRHGAACCTSPDNAVRALSALAAGAVRWEKLDVAAYAKQVGDARGFWMSFHELVSGYPWLTKRAARLLHPSAALPRRNALAYFFALFVPYAGPLGAGVGFAVIVYIVALVAAIGLPAYQDRIVQANLTQSVVGSAAARDALARYYGENRAIPRSLDDVDVPAQLPNGDQLLLDTDHMILVVKTRYGDLIFTPTSDRQGNIAWTCSNGKGLAASRVPAACRDM